MSLEPLGTMIRRRRTDRNLSQEQLAQLAGISRRHLLLIENNKANVSMEVVARIANALEMTEVFVGQLALRATPPDLQTLVLAGDAIDKAKKIILKFAEVAEQLDQSQQEIDEMIRLYAAAADADDSREKVLAGLKKLEDAGTDEANATLREIASRKGRSGSRAPDPAAAKPAARRRAR